MTQNDRMEVKDMLHDILSGWKAGYESHVIVTNDSLKKIERHLEKLNGLVGDHEKIISKNLPHNIAHCPQAPTIEKLNENMITSRVLRNYFITAIGILGTIMGVYYVIFEILMR